MKKPSWTFSPPRAKPRGATLIEALAGLVVLGTLLVSITIARGRFVRQRALAEQKIAAATAVDSLVSNWMAGSGSAIPLSAAGALDGLPNHTWRTRVIENKPDLNASIIRVEVTNQSNVPILTLDLLRHDDRRPLKTVEAPR
jgi:type II secretory pathway pseudopilin PulG